jgi:chorismate mutase
MTKWRTTYDEAVERGTLLDAVAEFKRQGGTIPSVDEAVEEFIRGGGTLEQWEEMYRQVKAEHEASKPLQALIDRRKPPR